MTTNTNTATNAAVEAIFTPNTLTMRGKTFPAAYSITPAGTVYVFVTVQEAGKDANLRIKITPDDPSYPAALAVARTMPEIHPVPVAQQEPNVQREPEAQLEPEVQPEPEAQPEPKAQPEPEVQPEPEAQPEQKAQPACGPAPEKTFIGNEIKGNGWKIVFDGSYQRTRVIFSHKPAQSAEEAVKNAGFYWSPVMESWNKKLTFKAFRAAQALALELHAICG